MFPMELSHLLVAVLAISGLVSLWTAVWLLIAAIYAPKSGGGDVVAGYLVLAFIWLLLPLALIVSPLTRVMLESIKEFKENT